MSLIISIHETFFHRDFDKVDLSCDEHRNCHILFRKKFNLSEKLENAVIYITADDYYKLYINGRFVGQGPASGYHFDYNYNVIDISDYLKEGEKGFYMGDGSLTSLTHMILTGDDSMVKKLINDGLASACITEGLLTSINSSHMQEIAESALMLTILILRHYKFTGDKEYLKTIYPKIVNVIECYRKNYEKDYVISNLDKWCVVEWPPNFRDGYDVNIEQNQICKEPHIEINAYYLQAVRSLNGMAEALGLPPYRDTKPLIDAFYKTFYVKEKHLFKDGKNTEHISIVGNCFPFGFGLIPDEEFGANFINMIKNKKISSVNMACAHIILSGLYALGEIELVKGCIEDKTAWIQMLKEGATTTFETWGKELKWNTSLFHPTLSYVAMYIADIDHRKILTI